MSSEGGSFNDRCGRVFKITCKLADLEGRWENPLGVVSMAVGSRACKSHVADARFVEVPWKCEGEQEPVAALILRYDGSAVAHHDAVEAPEFSVAEDVVGPYRQSDSAVDIEDLNGMVKNVPEEVIAVPGACTGVLRPEVNVFT